MRQTPEKKDVVSDEVLSALLSDSAGVADIQLISW
jgi:hypothetical protein